MQHFNYMRCPLIFIRFCFKEYLQQVFRHPFPYDFFSNAHNLNRIMFNRLMCGLHIMNDRGSDSWDLIAGDTEIRYSELFTK